MPMYRTYTAFVFPITARSFSSERWCWNYYFIFPPLDSIRGLRPSLFYSKEVRLENNVRRCDDSQDAREVKHVEITARLTGGMLPRAHWFRNENDAGARCCWAPLACSYSVAVSISDDVIEIYRRINVRSTIDQHLLSIRPIAGLMTSSSHAHLHPRWYWHLPIQSRLCYYINSRYKYPCHRNPLKL